MAQGDWNDYIIIVRTEYGSIDELRNILSLHKRYEIIDIKEA